MNVAVALACLMLVGFAQGAIPTESTCLSAFERAGLETLQTSLTPCAFSASSTCCNNIANLIGLDAESEFAGCLCNQGVVDLMINQIESNALAQSIGFDGDRLMNVLTTCNAHFVGTPSCASTPARSPPAVVVDVETTGVSVSVGTTDAQESSTDFDTTELLEESVMVEPPPTAMADEGRKEDGDLQNADLVFGTKGKSTPDAQDSTSFEDARKKIDVIKKNLAMTQDTVTDSVLEGKEKVLDMKAGTPSSVVHGMTVEPKKTAPETK